MTEVVRDMILYTKWIGPKKVIESASVNVTASKGDAIPDGQMIDPADLADFYLESPAGADYHIGWVMWENPDGDAAFVPGKTYTVMFALGTSTGENEYSGFFKGHQSAKTGEYTWDVSKAYALTVNGEGANDSIQSVEAYSSMVRYEYTVPEHGLEHVAADLGSGEGYRLNDLLKDLHHAHSQVLAAGRRLNEVISAHHMDTNELLLSIPGIGRVTAARICLEVPHVSNFINSDHLASYIGFVPDVHGSDDNVYVRGITYRGRALLRSAFVESAWRAIGRDPAMGLAYSNYIKRGLKPNNAIIRIARKLVNRVFFVLRERKRYEIARVR